MPWFKVDDQLAFNAKVVAAENEAMGLWVRCGSWSSAQLTDGFIPTHMANAMANGMAKECGADALVMAGLWDEVEGGYKFHDWSEFQPSASSEREKRRKRSLAGQMGAEARWGGKSDGKPHGKSHADRMANECEVDAPTRPDPTPNTHDRFAEFYSEYPRREARKKASTAFSKAIAGGADPQTIIAKAKIYAQAVKDHERKHIALPATWLNGERWDDEIELPPTGSEGGPSIWDRIQPRQNEG